MAERRRVFVFKQEIQDNLNTPEKIRAAIQSGKDPSEFEGQTDMVDESKITALCEGCDFFKGVDANCKKVGRNDQLRYANRGWCGWAEHKGKPEIHET